MCDVIDCPAVFEWYLPMESGRKPKEIQRQAASRGWQRFELCPGESHWKCPDCMKKVQQEAASAQQAKA